MPTTPFKPFRLPEPLLLVLFFLVAIGGCLDYKFSFVPCFTSVVHVHLCLAAGALLLLSDREGAWRPRLLLTAAALAVTLLIAYGLRHLADRVPLRQVVGAALHSPGPYVWAAALWLASPMLLNRGPQHYSGRFRGAVLALCLYGAFCFASAAASLRPHGGLGSFIAFYHDRAVLFVVLFAWLRAAQASPDLRERGGRWMVYFFAVFLVLSALVAGAMITGGKEIQNELFALGLIHKEGFKADPTLPRVRLLFPMLHFNRTAYFMMFAALTMIVAYCSAGLRRGQKIALLALAVLAVLLMTETFTRGAIVATLAGIGLLGCLLSRRVLIALIAVFALILLLTPAHQRNHILTAFRYSTYEPQERMTSMKARQMVWAWGLREIGSHPLTGLGYGTNIIERAYIDYARKIKNPWVLADIKSGNAMQHLHNTPLEISAESGLPALLAFAAFTLLRWWMLVSTFRTRQGPARRRAAAWIAFECSIVVFSMIFYMLKQNSGFMIWYVWANILSESEPAGETRLPAPPALRVAEREPEAVEALA